MESLLNSIQQVKNALGNIRYELWAIKTGHVVPEDKAKAMSWLRGREKEASAIISAHE